MKLRAYPRVDSGVAVIELEGAVTLGEEVRLMRELIHEAWTSGYKNILLDLEGVTYIDSAGLGELVSCHRNARAQGGDIRLVHLQKKVRGLLQITRLTTIFQTYEDEREAVLSFEPPDAARS